MLGQILKTFGNCLKIPELRSRIIFTVLVLLVARIVALTPIPGLDGHALNAHIESRSSEGGGVVNLYSMFTGGALEKCSVGSLGIMPYISATIIIQLLSAVLPGLAKLSREEGGRAKIIAYGRYLTVLLCLGQGLVMAIGWENPKATFDFDGKLVLIDNRFIYLAQTVVILTTGTLMLMWLGEQISERGVGNGVSLVITIGILARLPLAASEIYSGFVSHEGLAARYHWPHAVLMVLLLVVVVAGVIMVTQAQRKIPVQYAQRAVGKKVYAGGNSFMPLRVNYAGVMPVIFASAILMFPALLFDKLGQAKGLQFFLDLARLMKSDSWFYLAAESLMIVFFSYFWVATQFNELQIADDLKKHGGYIPGVRPGAATSDFLHRSMSRLTLAGAIFLAVLAGIPWLMNRFMHINFNVATFFGGTSLLITVGVLLDTMRQMESYLLLRQYDGFLKKGRVRGRS
ncbi:MAG: preprotein translocase subunit SecY [Verrucomicrobia bacterium]|nr:MAG: preprotein translocase subunit SecY [Verrucomicrobiota bacterium]